MSSTKTHITEATTVISTDQIHMAFNELRLMGIIVSPETLTINDTTDDDDDDSTTGNNETTILKIDYSKLYFNGYVLIFDGTKPIFCRSDYFDIGYNYTLFADSFIPFESLYTYSLLTLKNQPFSL